MQNQFASYDILLKNQGDRLQFNSQINIIEIINRVTKHSLFLEIIPQNQYVNNNNGFGALEESRAKIRDESNNEARYDLSRFN